MIETPCLKNVIFIQTIFSFNNKEVKRIGKNGEEITKIISFKLQFIYSARFMASLSNVVGNLAQGMTL